MFGIILSLVIIVSVLLVLVVLAQNSKGGGATQMVGSASNQILGAAKTGDVLEKLTWGFAIALITLCLASNFVVDKGTSTNEVESANIEKAAESGPVAPAAKPNAGANKPAAGESKQ